MEVPMKYRGMDINGGPVDFNLRTSGLLFLAINFPQGIKSNTPHRHDYLKKSMVQASSQERKRDKRRNGRGRKGEGEDILICKPSIKPRLPIKVLSFRTLELTQRPP